MSEIDNLFSQSKEIFDKYESLYNKIEDTLKKASKTGLSQEQENNLYETINSGLEKMNEHLAQIRVNKGTSYDKAKELYPAKNPAAWGKEGTYNRMIKSMNQYKRNIENTLSRTNPDNDTLVSTLENYINNI